MAQGGTFKSGFASGFSASFFSPGTTMGGDGAGGFGLRTSIAAIAGGTASALGGGKFSNGAISGAFVHMFNAEQVLKRYLKNDDLGILKGYRISQEKDRLLGLPDSKLLNEFGFDSDEDWRIDSIRDSLNASFNRYLLVSAARGFPGSDGFYDFIPRNPGGFFDAINFVYDTVGSGGGLGYDYYCVNSKCGVLVYDRN